MIDRLYCIRMKTLIMYLKMHDVVHRLLGKVDRKENRCVSS